MLDNRSPLMKRLAEIMPKKPEPPKTNLSMMSFETNHIRKAADSFASWMGNERLLPANNEELLATLWVFGEMLNGELERMLNESHRHHMDLLKTLPIKPQIIDLSMVDEYLVSKNKLREKQ